MDIKLEITEVHQGIRVDDLISKSYDLISRSRAASLLKNGKILVSERKVKPSYKVKAGEIVQGTFTDSAAPDITPQKIDLNIVFEDEHIIVINKPAGLVVHPGAGNDSGTLVNALLYHCPGIVCAGEDKSRAGIVHRLDKDTSGIMVAAKNDHALNFLKKEFKQRRVKKVYSALVKGVVTNESGRITLPLGRHPHKRTIMSIEGENARHAETLWHVQKRYKDATLVSVLLKTGRTHQIRVHFYALSHPLIGEKVYQFRRLRKKSTSVKRPMLHSFYIKFRHPFSGRSMEFSVPLPEDFNILLAKLKKLKEL